MSGRVEKEEQYENKCNNLLMKMPNIARVYYVYFKASDSKRTNVSCHTYLAKLGTYFNYLEINGIDPDDLSYYATVKPADITMYLDYYRNSNGKKKKDSSVALVVNVIKSFYSFLEDNGYINRTPCGKINAPKTDNRIKPVYMDKAEIDKVKNYILYSEESFYNHNKNEEYWRLRDYLIFVLGCRTGLRCSAISAIDVDDINFEDSSILVVEKGNVTRKVYFGSNTKDILVQWLNARRYILDGELCDALLISKFKTRISNQRIIAIVKKYTSAVIPDKNITPHKMRSTCATNLWAETHDIYMVANQLGHRNLSNTKRYTDISEKESRRVANILDEL